jgi:hypothetical protein
MRIENDKLNPTVNSLLTKTSDLTRKSVLATAKVAGRATRLTHEGAMAMVREAVNAVVWTNDRILPAAKFLNPFGRVKSPRPLKTFSGRISDVPVRRIRKTMRTALSREGKLRPGLKRAAVKSRAAHHPRVKKQVHPGKRNSQAQTDMSSGEIASCFTSPRKGICSSTGNHF